MDTKIEELLEAMRKKLVGTETRSRLIYVNRKTQRGNLLNIVHERSDDVFRILRIDGTKMKFAGKGKEEEDKTGKNNPPEVFDKSRYTDSVLETELTPDALQNRLLSFSKNARTAEEEQGVNILFLSLGFLQWYEDEKSEILRESPLILLPVALVRNNRTSTFDIVCRDDDIITNRSLRERMKIIFGISLPEIDDTKDWTPSEYFAKVEKAISAQKRWKIAYDGMQLGFFSFAKLIMYGDLDPDKWDGRSILDNKLIRGLLKDGFQKDEFQSEPPLIEEHANLDCNKNFQPENILQVVDADSSQTKVIQEVRAEKNMVVQGPPGTGKSQTITNILAAAVHDNKKVLFVAEKMAALEVVYKRMCDAGLKDLCLELHSRRANKKLFLEELAETISRSSGAQLSKSDTSSLRHSRDELNRITVLLHTSLPNREYTPFKVLAELVPFISQDTSPPQFDASHLESISPSEEEELFRRLDDYVEIVYEYGSGECNPFYGSENLGLQPPDLLRLKKELKDAIKNLNAWINRQRTWEEQLELEPVLTLASADKCKFIYQELKNAPDAFLQFIGLVHTYYKQAIFSDSIKSAAEWVEHKRRMSNRVKDIVWNYDLDSLRPQIVKGVDSWIARIFGKYRAESKKLASYLRQDMLLPKSPADRLQLLDQIIEGKIKKRVFDEESGYLKSTLGEHWRGEQTPFSSILEVVNWLKAAPKELRELSAEKLSELIEHEVTLAFDSELFDSQRETLLSAIEQVAARLQLKAISAKQIEHLSLSLETLKHRMSAMSADKYRNWVKHQLALNALLAWQPEVKQQLDRDTLPESPIIELLELIGQGEVELEDASAELRYALYEERWNYAMKQESQLDELEQLDRHTLVTSFSAAEKERFKEVRQLIRNKHLSQVPKGSAGEMGFIRHEIAKKRRHFPIRTMMKRAAEVIQRIKPVFLMSPISVAQFLPPNKVEFDLLVIDEASQVRPEDALGSIARAKQIVVVGDQKQLPPTDFFGRLTDNTDPVDEEDEEALAMRATTETESVLSLCEAKGLNQRMLMWHYRSRDPSLIAFSNVEFYDGRLMLPPCPTESGGESGLKLVRVPGVYSPTGATEGRPRTNEIEAERIADRLKKLALLRPDFSVGIVTFSKSQADMVTKVLEERRREDEVLNQFLRENKFENVFVKNIENVQGDERDIILISVGYAHRKLNGDLGLNFGPINFDEGGRRLNVLFTRSRIACEVFASFDPEEIDLARTSRKGPEILKGFLQYAQDRKLPGASVSQGEPDSPFEEEVANVIREMEYEVDHQVEARCPERDHQKDRPKFKIDLGVKGKAPGNPDHYILAVECDGATYHSSLSARERDRLRQEILEDQGWHFHRIWSTDWFYNTQNEKERLRKALEEASKSALSRSHSGANSQSDDQEHVEQDDEEDAPIILEESNIEVPKYRKADIIVDSMYEPHERPLEEVVNIVCKIVRIEGPVHRDEITRRYASAHDKARVGSLISGRVSEGLARAKKEAWLVSRGEFWGTRQQFIKVPVRDRSEESPPTARAESISPDEIRDCARLIKKDSGAIEEDELIRAIAKAFGFKRAGPGFQSVVKAALRAE